MKRVLITGMSGVGKSSVLAHLRCLGYKTVDTDYGGWVQTVPVTDDPYGAETEQLLDEDRFRTLLAIEDASILFVSCTTRNQGTFYPEFDAVVLLSAPPDVVRERLTSRTTNTYGKDPEELAEALRLQETVEPLLWAGATLEVDTTTPLEEVVATILDHTGVSRPSQVDS